MMEPLLQYNATSSVVFTAVEMPPDVGVNTGFEIPGVGSHIAEARAKTAESTENCAGMSE